MPAEPPLDVRHRSGDPRGRRRGGVARTVHISRQLGTPEPIAPADVEALYARYQNAYGQETAWSRRSGS